MKRQFRLSRSSDFKRVRGLGKSFAHPLAVLVAAPAVDNTPTRIGITTGRAVGGAVQRNRVKRRLRECLTGLLQEIQPGWDLILIARQPIVQAEFSQICAAVEQLFRRAQLLSNSHAD